MMKSENDYLDSVQDIKKVLESTNIYKWFFTQMLNDDLESRFYKDSSKML